MTKLIKITGNKLFERVVSILEQARSNVVKSVNSNMVLAYWLIGREIVEELQQGKDRAAYGKELLESLSNELNHRFGRGFSVTNLKYFRMFYQAYSDRAPEIRHTAGDEFEISQNGHRAGDVFKRMELAVKKNARLKGFSALLSWSHYRALLRVENDSERMFYEIEAENENWSVAHLNRQINTLLFARLLKSKDKDGLIKLSEEGQVVEKPADLIKNPYILDFLGLPESNRLHESKLEEAIIENIQAFLLELGKGFAFVARQKRVSTENSEFYIDLVFYNFHLKCFVLIDLKTGKLTHQDIGQMDMYVRMFDDLQRGEDDNPTVGLILCTEKDKTLAKYSVLNENQQLFASKYMMYLPSEEELIKELERGKHQLSLELSTKRRQPK